MSRLVTVTRYEVMTHWRRRYIGLKIAGDGGKCNETAEPSMTNMKMPVRMRSITIRRLVT